MKIKALFFLVIASFVLISCASNNVEKSNLNKVYVTNTTKVDLLPSTAISEEIDEYQQFSGNFGDSSLFAISYIYADNKGIDIILLNELGIEIATISYDGKNATIDSNVLPKKLKAEYILLDIQNAFVNSEILKNHYAKYKLNFEEKNGIRTISQKNKIIETISYENNTIIIKNHLRKYEYKLAKEN